jgi:Xaa-Pro dipeptidase
MKLALAELKAAMRPGMTVSDADAIVRQIISENDVGARLVTRSGYSIGIAFPPSWDEGYILSLNPGDSTILEEGMTFHVIPWMWGVDGDKTVGISDTIRITADGCASFFELDQDFTVKGDAGSYRSLTAVGAERTTTPGVGDSALADAEAADPLDNVHDLG